ncbi:MAG: hypothetical protein J3K34DRAFT_70916 [Monoraphidium minutum]|nr:MAG: hypothetical protein J3K34DRAFT_70916 [Monoraphidium minutum]
MGRGAVGLRSRGCVRSTAGAALKGRGRRRRALEWTWPRRRGIQGVSRPLKTEPMGTKPWAAVMINGAKGGWGGAHPDAGAPRCTPARCMCGAGGAGGGPAGAEGHRKGWQQAKTYQAGHWEGGGTYIKEAAAATEGAPRNRKQRISKQAAHLVQCC